MHETAIGSRGEPDGSQEIWVAVEAKLDEVVVSGLHNLFSRNYFILKVNHLWDKNGTGDQPLFLVPLRDFKVTELLHALNINALFQESGVIRELLFVGVKIERTVDAGCENTALLTLNSAEETAGAQQAHPENLGFMFSRDPTELAVRI
jgi:hypothetical protein